MRTRRQSFEALVGVLIILGILTIGYLIVTFGKLERKIQEHYQVSLQVDDATGLRGGVPVRLGGVLVGHVAGVPKLADDYSSLIVTLEIFDAVRIPDNAPVSIGTVGLMGDNYIKINLPQQPSGTFIEPGATLRARPAVGLKALQNDAENLLSSMNQSITDLNSAINNLDRVFSKMDQVLGSDSGSNDIAAAIADIGDIAAAVKDASEKLDPLLSNAEIAIADFRDTAASLKESSGKVDPLITAVDDTIGEFKATANDARDAIETAENAFENGDRALQDIAAAANRAGPTMEQLESLLFAMRETLDRIDRFTELTEQNDGLLKALRDDPELRKDFTSLIDKLEANGVIFYPREKKRDKAPLFQRNPSRGQ